MFMWVQWQRGCDFPSWTEAPSVCVDKMVPAISAQVHGEEKQPYTGPQTSALFPRRSQFTNGSSAWICQDRRALQQIKSWQTTKGMRGGEVITPTYTFCRAPNPPGVSFHQNFVTSFSALSLLPAGSPVRVGFGSFPQYFTRAILSHLKFLSLFWMISWLISSQPSCPLHILKLNILNSLF